MSSNTSGVDRSISIFQSVSDANNSDGIRRRSIMRKFFEDDILDQQKLVKWIHIAQPFFNECDREIFVIQKILNCLLNNVTTQPPGIFVLRCPSSFLTSNVSSINQELHDVSAFVDSVKTLTLKIDPLLSRTISDNPKVPNVWRRTRKACDKCGHEGLTLTNSHNFRLACDASDHDIGAALYTIINGEDIPIDLTNHTWNSAQRMYVKMDKDSFDLILNVRNYLTDEPYRQCSILLSLIWVRGCACNLNPHYFIISSTTIAKNSIQKSSDPKLVINLSIFQGSCHLIYGGDAKCCTTRCLPSDGDPSCGTTGWAQKDLGPPSGALGYALCDVISP
ncbi:hypothetical protein RF11_14022 [Thelohanellus kitauei]|uniref:Reverse transcriptase/retrotransposon-derived protein RNase H-like domain-containing protein n=1 Tax=Thelohanellus kitauei TaxID=669202 RepID=A0A0C2M6H7_THEKT|nr:hypothetical protein RF11_14022 [Thelohanellus kitauei]